MNGREHKLLKTRAWYRSQRGGTKVAMGKDYPEMAVKKEAGGCTGKPDWKKTWKHREDKEDRDIGKDGGGMIKVVEMPIFIPYTKESSLRKKLQELDDRIGEATGTPAPRFVERCGGGAQSLICLEEPILGPEIGSVNGRCAYHARVDRC